MCKMISEIFLPSMIYSNKLLHNRLLTMNRHAHTVTEFPILGIFGVKPFLNLGQGKKFCYSEHKMKEIPVKVS